MARNTRQTSIDALNKIKESGLLKKLAFDVYKEINTFGQLGSYLTGAEIHESLGGQTQTSTVRARITELTKMKCVKPIGKRECTVTGIKAMTWAATGSLPVKVIVKSKDQIIKDLKSEIKELRKISDQCQSCGCSEFLCGHNKR